MLLQLQLLYRYSQHSNSCVCPCCVTKEIPKHQPWCLGWSYYGQGKCTDNKLCKWDC